MGGSFTGLCCCRLAFTIDTTGEPVPLAMARLRAEPHDRGNHHNYNECTKQRPIEHNAARFLVQIKLELPRPFPRIVPAGYLMLRPGGSGPGKRMFRLRG